MEQFKLTGGDKSQLEDKVIEFMSLIFTTLNDYASSVAASATVVIAGLTLFLFLENRKLRKAGTEPNVVAYLLPHPDGTGGINFVLSNIGQGPALNIHFEFDYDEEDFKEHGVLLLNNPQRTQTSVLPQGEKISALFGISFRLAGQNGRGFLKPFTVKIKYSDINNKPRTSSQIIDVSQFAGLAGMFAKPASREIADSLQKIEKHLGAIAKNSASNSTNILDVTTVSNEYRQSAPIVEKAKAVKERSKPLSKK